MDANGRRERDNTPSINPQPSLANTHMKKAFEVSTIVLRCETFSDIIDALNHGLKVKLLVYDEEEACDCVFVKNGIEVVNADGKHVQFLEEDDFLEGVTCAYAIFKKTLETTNEGYQVLFAKDADYENSRKYDFLNPILG